MAIKGPSSTSDRQRREEGVRDFFNEKRGERITTYQLESFDVVFPNGLQDQNIVNITVVHSDSNDFSERVPLKFVFLDKEQNQVEREFVYLFKRNAIVDLSLPEEKEEQLSETEQQDLIRRLMDGKFAVEGELISFLKTKIESLLPEGANFAEITEHEGKKALIVEIQPVGVGITRAFVYDAQRGGFQELYAPQVSGQARGRWLIAGIGAATVAALALLGRSAPNSQSDSSTIAASDSAEKSVPNSSTQADEGSQYGLAPLSSATAAAPESASAAEVTTEAEIESTSTASVISGAETTPATTSKPPASTTLVPETANSDEESEREAQRAEIEARIETLKSELGQFLNPQGLTAAQCDEALDSWSRAEGNPEQLSMTEQWRALRAFVGLQTEINGNLDQLMSTAGSAEALEALEELLNPNNLSVEQIDASIAEWEKPEFADHPESADTLRRWRVWRFLVEFLEREVRPFYERVREMR